MNFRTLTTACAGLALFSAIVTVTLWRELRSEREHTAALQAQLKESAAHARVALVPVPAPAATQSKPAPIPAAAPAPAAVAPPATMVSVIQGSGINEQELLKDPDYRKARLAMLRSTMAQTYPGLVEELGLSKEEADRLFDLLAENQMAMTSQLTLFNGSQPPDPAALAEATRTRQAQQRQQEDSVRAMLGDTRYTQWQDYQPTRSARMQAGNFATTLAQAGAPLDSAQNKALVTALVAQQRNLQQDMASLVRSADPANPQSRTQMQEALRTRQAENNQRILAAATPHLSAQQLGILREQFEQQDAINRAAARARERAEAARSPQ